jgi:amino acid transporter
MRLVRSLTFIEVLAMPVALMAPTAGMSLNTPFAALTAGTATPFIFVLSTIGIACVGAGFIRLTRHFNDAGSVYGLTKAAVGPRYGFIAGWCLALVYVTFVGTLLSGFATFADLLVAGITGIQLPWMLTVLVGGAAVWLLGYRSIKLSVHIFMVAEGVSILLMFVLAAAIFAKGGAHGNSLSLTPLTPSGASFSGLSAALVFGFLTYIGFEGSATLGEESENPQRAIPLTVFSAVILSGLVFIIISFAQTVGFGLDAAGVKAYGSSAAPNTDLAQIFIGSWFGMVLNAGAAISTFACALASADGAARVLFSLGRDERLPLRLAAIHPKHHSPYWALGVSMVIGLLVAAAFVPFTDSPSNVYGWTGALATLAVIIAYGMTSIAAVIYFWKEDLAKRQYYQFLPIVVAVPLLAYTFNSQILPVPPAPLRYWPYVMLAFLAVGAAILIAQRNRVVKRDAAWEDRQFATQVEGAKP